MWKMVVVVALVLGLLPSASNSADKILSGKQIKEQVEGKTFDGQDGYNKCAGFTLKFRKGGKMDYDCHTALGVPTANAAVRGNWFISGNQLCTQDRWRGRYCDQVVRRGKALRWSDGYIR